MSGAPEMATTHAMMPTAAAPAKTGAPISAAISEIVRPQSSHATVSGVASVERSVGGAGAGTAFFAFRAHSARSRVHARTSAKRRV